MVIYCIKNSVTNKLYVGMSTNHEKRWKNHKYMLNNNKHDNIYLQNSWNKHGENTFQFYILERLTNKKQLRYSEKLWIKILKTLYPNGYNFTKGGTGGVTNLQSMVETKRKNSTNILQYDKNGNFIKDWNSIPDIIDNTINFTDYGIRTNLIHNGEYLYKDNVFIEKQDDNYPYKITKPKTKKQLNIDSKKEYCVETHVYNLSGEYINSYPSIKETARKLNLHYPSVRQAIKNNGSTDKYQFSKIKKKNLAKYIKNHYNTVAKTLNGKILNVYKSYAEAARKNDSDQRNIRRSVKKGIKCKGYIYKNITKKEYYDNI